MRCVSFFDEAPVPLGGHEHHIVGDIDSRNKPSPRQSRRPRNRATTTKPNFKHPVGGSHLQQLQRRLFAAVVSKAIIHASTRPKSLLG